MTPLWLTLEGQPPGALIIKKFNKSSFSYNDFFVILATHRNASASGLNGIPFARFTKNVQKQTYSFSKFFKLALKDEKSLGNCELLKRYVFLKLAIHLIPNSQTFAQ